MRFPWLQVDADFISAHAGDLGAHLGISRREAMGLALDLWTWALARAKDDAPPDGMITGTGPVPDRLLAGSVGWTGSVEAFSAALLAVGLVVRVDGGYRLTGFERYRVTWEKNRRRTGGKPERNRSGTGEEPARKTQTQTQKKEENPPNPPRGDGARKEHVTHSPTELPRPPPVQLEPLPFEPGPELRRSSSAAWTIPDAVRAVHREVQEGRDYAWDLVHDERAATALTSLCSAEGLPPAAWPAEIARRFGRALIRSLWQYERREGKAVTLRELARRECWAINADAPSRVEKLRDGFSAVVSEKSVTYDPWDWVLAKQQEEA